MEDKRPLRVCFVFAASGIGGAERSMLRLMERTHPHRFECSVIVLGATNPKLRAELDRMGIILQEVRLLDLGRLWRLLKRIQPDIVYLFGPVRASPAAIVAGMAHVPLIVGAERSSLNRSASRFIRWIDRFFVDGYITNSKIAAQGLETHIGIPKERIFVIYNGMEPSDPPVCQTPQDIALGNPSILCVANIRPEKGHLVLLQAIANLRTFYPRIRAVLVGTDLTGGRFFSEAGLQGLSDTFTWVGFVPDVRGYLLQADLFVLPSLYREGTPTSILEAMLEGLPVVASHVGGVGELIQHGQTGILVEPGDPLALAEAIHYLLENEDTREAIRKEARAYVLQHHSMQKMVDAHLQVFQGLLAASGEP
jgi:glycosyltransferase involved in cell wall biosynthesis